MNVKQTIEKKLLAGFPDAEIEVIDESHKHAGHAGARPEGETHFSVILTSSAFAGQSRLTRQRAIMRVLSEELEGPVHALAIVVKTPDEA